MANVFERGHEWLQASHKDKGFGFVVAFLEPLELRDAHYRFNLAACVFALAGQFADVFQELESATTHEEPIVHVIQYHLFDLVSVNVRKLMLALEHEMEANVTRTRGGD